MKSSLKISFMPSASVCSSPNGPALFGPMRFCSPAITLRSNHTMNIVPTRPMTNTTRTLSKTMSSGVHWRSPNSSGSRPSIRRGSRRRRPASQALDPDVVDGRGEVDDVRRARRPLRVERDDDAPLRDGGVADEREDHRAAGSGELHLGAFVDAEAGEVERVDGGD